MKDNTKKLGLILSGIVLIIIIIVLFYFITYLFNIKKDEPNITTTTTKKIDEGFKNISNEEKIKLNKNLNNDELIISFNNAFDNNYNLKNVNLFETEISKFKFIYTYLKLNDINEVINHELINNYSQKIFRTDLYEGNFNQYLKNNYYEYNIQYDDINYCLKSYKKKNDILLIDMIKKDEINCDINLTDYESTLVLHKIELKYEVVDGNYIYKSFIIVK